jgi:hypothetical protein
MNDELSSKQRRSLDERFKSRPQVYVRLQQNADMMDRLKLSGCWWKETNAAAVLNLRVARANQFMANLLVKLTIFSIAP